MLCHAILPKAQLTSPGWAFFRLDFVHVSLQIWDIEIAYDRDFTLGGFTGEFHSPQGK